MKNVILGILTLVSASTFASEVINRPRIKGLEIQCGKDLNNVCKHLGFTEAINSACSKNLRTRLLSTNVSYENNKSVVVLKRLNTCDETTWANIAENAIGEMMSTVDVECETYARFKHESGDTKILKKIECI